MNAKADVDLEPFAGDEPDNSAAVLAALRKAEDAFRTWQTTCDVIDQIYSRDGYGPAGRADGEDGFAWQDATMDLFWSSFEVMKPAIYARPPQPVVAPLFKDNRRLHTTTAEVLERCAVSVFKRTEINDVMIALRDDLLFAGRGTPWVRYEREDGEQRVCVEHKDRLDFLHEPARKWSEVGWVAGASWLTKKDMRERFAEHSGEAWKEARYTQRKDDEADALEKRAATPKCKVWEVWHRADNRVYWVTEGVDRFLDKGEPELKLAGFFPCPRPAYATLRRRSLIPVPDYERYSIHFDKISKLTSRIYLLLDKVRMKGLIPAGGDIREAVEQLLRSNDDEILIPVPSAAMLGDGAASFVAWLPLKEVAEAIQGLIEARGQLINDFYQLSGISDIMRGATEAEETLGAQQLKAQFGSIRVREKSSELQRCAADAVKIAAEIIADKFTPETILELCQMDIPDRAAVEKRVKEIEAEARKELQALGEKAQQAAAQHAQQAPQQPAQGQQQPGQGIDPAQAEQAFQQAQQAILAKYAPQLAEAEQAVVLEDVIKLLRDDRARAFTFEIESSSTILNDELAEKQSRNEFMEAFTSSSQALMGMAAMGEPGAKLAGELMRFTLAPYRAGRTLDGAIDEFIDAAPQMAAAAQAAANSNAKPGESEAMAEANKTLAEAEMTKARAATAAVEAKAALDKAEMQRKLAEMQQKGAEAEHKAGVEVEKLRQSMSAEQAKTALIEAQINKLTADTAVLLHSIGLDERRQQLDEYRAVHDQQADIRAHALQADKVATDNDFRRLGEDRADRQQQFTEQQAQAERNDNG